MISFDFSLSFFRHLFLTGYYRIPFLVLRNASSRLLCFGSFFLYLFIYSTCLKLITKHSLALASPSKKNLKLINKIRIGNRCIIKLFAKLFPTDNCTSTKKKKKIGANAIKSAIKKFALRIWWILSQKIVIWHCQYDSDGFRDSERIRDHSSFHHFSDWLILFFFLAFFVFTIKWFLSSILQLIAFADSDSLIDDWKIVFKCQLHLEIAVICALISKFNGFTFFIEPSNVSTLSPALHASFNKL